MAEKIIFLPCDTRYGGGKVGITEYYGSVFSSELQRDFLHGAGGQLGDPLAYQSGPGEGDHPDLESGVSKIKMLSTPQ